MDWPTSSDARQVTWTAECTEEKWVQFEGARGPQIITRTLCVLEHYFLQVYSVLTSMRDSHLDKFSSFAKRPPSRGREIMAQYMAQNEYTASFPRVIHFTASVNMQVGQTPYSRAA